MFDKVKPILRSEIVKNSFILLSSSSISQLIAIGVYPVVTRLYTPADLGVMNLFLSITGICSILASLQMQSAIIISEKHSEARSVFDLIFITNLILSLLIIFSLLFFEDWIVRIFGIEVVGGFVWVIPLIVFLGTLGTVLTYWFNRQNKFAMTARYNLAQSASNSGLKVLLGILGVTRSGLIIANIGGAMIGLCSVIFPRRLYFGLFRFNKARMSLAFKKHVNFPVYTLPHTLINTLAGNLPVMVLAIWFNMHDVGLFSLGFTLGFRPINLFTESIRQVLFQKVSVNYANGKNSFMLVKQLCTKIVATNLPIYFILFFTVKSLTIWLFGKEWAGSGVYLQMMLPWFFMITITSSLSFMPAVMGKQRQAMVFEIIYTLARVLALFIGVWMGDIHKAILLYVSACTLFLCFLLYWYINLSKQLQE